MTRTGFPRRRQGIVAASVAAAILSSCTASGPRDTEAKPPTPVPRHTPPVLDQISEGGPWAYPDPGASFPEGDEAPGTREVTRTIRPDRLNDPAPGVYVYESVQEARPADLQSSVYTRERRLEVAVLRRHGSETEFAYRYADEGDNAWVTTWRERWDPSGVVMTHLWGCPVNPPMLFFRFPLQEGNAYPPQETSYGDGCDPRTRPPQWNIRVLGKEPVFALGRHWETWRVERHEPPSPPPREITETLWMSPELGIPIRRVADLKGGGGQNTHTDTLESM